MSSGHAAPRGPWNEGPEWQFGSPRNRRSTGGDGFAAVNVAKKEVEVPGAMAARTALDTTADPITGADLDSGQAKTKTWRPDRRTAVSAIVFPLSCRSCTTRTVGHAGSGIALTGPGMVAMARFFTAPTFRVRGLPAVGVAWGSAHPVQDSGQARSFLASVSPLAWRPALHCAFDAWQWCRQGTARLPADANGKRIERRAASGFCLPTPENAAEIMRHPFQRVQRCRLSHVVASSCENYRLAERPAPGATVVRPCKALGTRRHCTALRRRPGYSRIRHPHIRGACP